MRDFAGRIWSIGVCRQATVSRRNHVKADLVLDLRSVPLAEGIESEADAEVCRELGFKLIQGFLIGRPIPANRL